MTQRDPAKQLAKELADLRKEVRSGSRGSQMRFRALEGGAIPVYDGDGNPTGSIGLLPDGSTGFDVTDGPKPVAPSAPILFPLVGGLEVEWNGETFDGSDLPGDFRCVEVHAAPYGSYEPSPATLRVNVIRPGTITIRLPATDAWTIYFVIRTTAGKTSDPSVGATETPEAMPSEADIQAARQAAADAQTAAQAASDQALEASGLAATKGTVYYGTVAPDADPNGLWIDQTGGANTPKRHDGTAWAAVTDKAATDAADAAAAAQAAADSALSAAETAQQKANDAFTKAEAAAISADGKNRVFWRDASNPPPDPLITGDVWFVQDQDNKPRIYRDGAWADATFADGAIAFLNVSKLTTGQLNVGQKIIAGPLAGTHAELSDTGLRVFAEDPIDGIPNEVIRMGTETNDFFGISDANGALIAAVNENGGASFTDLNVTGDPIFQGTPLSQTMSEAMAGRVVGFFRDYLPADLQPINSEIGIVEVNGYLEAGRSYSIKAHFGWFQNIPLTEATFRIRSTRTSTAGGDTAPAPTITSTQEEHWWRSHRAHRRTFTEDLDLLYNCTRTGRHRFLLTADVHGEAGDLTGVSCNGIVSIPGGSGTVTRARVNFPWTYDSPPVVVISAGTSVPGTTVEGVGTSDIDTKGFTANVFRTNDTATNLHWMAEGDATTNSRLTIHSVNLTTMAIIDAGPTPPVSGQATAGGGVIGTQPVPATGTAPPAATQPPSPTVTKQQYYVDLGPVGKVSWRGNNTVRTDLAAWDVVQGRDPSGYNGIGKGSYWFNLPNITGTVDRVDLYLYSAHWYYNSGGMAVLNINDQRGSDPNMFKMRGDWLVGGYPKPGGKWVTVPADWLAFFKGTNNDLFNGRATTITIGPTNDDLVHYGRFTDCRLRIWYTQ